MAAALISTHVPQLTSKQFIQAETQPQYSSLCVVTAPVLAPAAPTLVSSKATGLTVNMDSLETEEDNTDDEASAASTSQSAQESPTVAKTRSPVKKDRRADGEAQIKLLFNLSMILLDNN